MKKLVISDMDGTLLNSANKIPDNIEDVIRKLNKKDVAFAVASGRQYPILRRDFYNLKDDMFFICENGAVTVKDDEIIHVEEIPTNLVKSTVELIKSIPEAGILLSTPKYAILEGTVDSEIANIIKDYFPSCKISEDVLDIIDGETICKVSAFIEKGKGDKLYKAVNDGLNEKLHAHLSIENWVDIMPLNVNKATALEFIKDYYQISSKDCIAFGDYLNDMEMLLSVEESYCMENGHEDLKKIAKHIAPSNDDEGVIKVLKELFEI